MTYVLEGLDCAHCAAKIEKEIQKIEGLADTTVNFATKTINIDPKYEEVVSKLLERIEPGVTLISQGNVSEAETLDDERREMRTMLMNIFLSSVILAIGLLTSERLHGRYEVAEYAIFIIAYLLAGRHVVYEAIRNIGRGQIFDENFLMTIATLGAFAIHELPEAVGVMLFYSVGEYFQALAVQRSRRSISALMDIRPDVANLKKMDGLLEVSPEKVAVGEIIVVRPGEKVPLDGVVVEGNSFLDTSSLTGESVPRRVAPGDKALAGTVNTEGLLEIQVEKPFRGILGVQDLGFGAKRRRKKGAHRTVYNEICKVLYPGGGVFRFSDSLFTASDNPRCISLRLGL